MVSIKINNGQAASLIDKLNALRFGAKARVETVLDETALLVESTAKELTPVDTGRLRASIHADKPGPLQRTVGSDVEYAIWVELGARGRPGTGFLFRAFELNRPRFIEKLKEAIRFKLL
ncbi:HK97 gp10 family phage protein [Hymenobacter fodinae]|uniref:HK97 gp10 family phage protein n=2 Tax=Hymenobacter fodinae TaxID=2510796 RepID=A0A4Z0P3H4_9BACT|nr:HK97 gp10 family phage protein [Hymenobacter fodinae]